MPPSQTVNVAVIAAWSEPGTLRISLGWSVTEGIVTPTGVHAAHGGERVEQGTAHEDVVDELAAAVVDAAVRLVGRQQRRQVPQAELVTPVRAAEPAGPDLRAGRTLQDLGRRRGGLVVHVAGEHEQVVGIAGRHALRQGAAQRRRLRGPAVQRERGVAGALVLVAGREAEPSIRSRRVREQLRLQVAVHDREVAAAGPDGDGQRRAAELVHRRRALRALGVVADLHRQQLRGEQPDQLDLAQHPRRQERHADPAAVRRAKCRVRHAPGQRLLQRAQRRGRADLLERHDVRPRGVDHLRQRCELRPVGAHRLGSVAGARLEQVLHVPRHHAHRRHRPHRPAAAAATARISAPMAPGSSGAGRGASEAPDGSLRPTVERGDRAAP